jgi:hypothetical protein
MDRKYGKVNIWIILDQVGLSEAFTKFSTAARGAKENACSFCIYNVLGRFLQISIWSLWVPQGGVWLRKIGEGFV